MYKKPGFYTIYKAISPSGKLYIGYTEYKLEDRIKLHKKSAIKYPHRPFYKALNKYQDKIKWEIINVYYTEQYAKSREVYFIKLFKSKIEENGYNCTDGGEGTPGLKQGRVKYIDNFGIIYNGHNEVYEKTGVTRESLGASIKYGYKCGKYYFSKYKEGMTQAKYVHTRSRTQPIICIELNKTFNTIRQAAKYFNTREQTISRVLSGKRKLFKGYSFKYLNKENKIFMSKRKNNKKIIDCSGNIYSSIREAAKVNKVERSCITFGIKHKRLVKGISFCIYDNNIKKCPKYIQKRTKLVKCLNTGKVFKSVKEASNFLSVDISTVIRNCKKKNISHRGLNLEYVTGGELFQY